MKWRKNRDIGSSIIEYRDKHGISLGRISQYMLPAGVCVYKWQADLFFPHRTKIFVYRYQAKRWIEKYSHVSLSMEKN